MSRAESLYRLQLLDTELDAARKRLHEITLSLEGSPALTHTRAELASAEKALHQAMSDLKSLEMDSQTLDEKIGADEQRLYAGAIRAPKEMVDVQTEVASLKKRRRALDDDMLVVMERVEQLKANEARCREALAQAERNFDDDSAHLKEERQRLLASAQAELERRQALAESVSKQDLNLYALIQTKKPNHIAVALLKAGACGQCGEMASSQSTQQAGTGTALAICSNCGRILYAQ
jgi:predicted  nucleic acid-binding Zn-ribbon protein